MISGKDWKMATNIPTHPHRNSEFSELSAVQPHFSYHYVQLYCLWELCMSFQWEPKLTLIQPTTLAFINIDISKNIHGVVPTFLIHDLIMLSKISLNTIKTTLNYRKNNCFRFRVQQMQLVGIHARIKPFVWAQRWFKVIFIWERMSVIL